MFVVTCSSFSCDPIGFNGCSAMSVMNPNLKKLLKRGALGNKCSWHGKTMKLCIHRKFLVLLDVFSEQYYIYIYNMSSRKV